MKRISLILTILLVLTLLVGASALAQGSDNTQSGESGEDMGGRYTLSRSQVSTDMTENPGRYVDGVYIVTLNAPPLSSYRGGIPGLPPTNPGVRGERKLDTESDAFEAYRNYLAERQQEVLDRAEQQLGYSVDVIYQYDVVSNGFSARITSEDASKIAAIEGVKRVRQDEWSYPTTDVTPDFLGATSIWDGSASGGVATKGEGIIVGIIDTGIWPEHPSFADDGSFPAPPAGWPICQPPDDGTTGYNCTNKLIGVQHFLDGYISGGTYDGLFNSGRDDNGHGTHTSGTSAGNENVPVTLLGVSRGNVSGIAPRAHVASYKALGPGGGTGADLEAAINKAVEDGVDVINYSIGGSSTDPWLDSDAQAFLNARDAGVFVATSAGNDGPGVSTLGSPGDAPWITTVGASTSTRHYISDITLSGPGTPPSGLYGASVTAGVTDYNLVDAEGILDSQGDSSGLCLNPYNTGTFNANDVVLCKRGQIARVARGDHVQAGGGGGVILYNPTMQGLGTDNFVIPAVHVENDLGQLIKDYVTAHTGQVTVSFTPGTAVYDTDPRVISDMMAEFSSRGPSKPVPGVIKPNVTAPGVQILAGASPEHVEQGAQGEFWQSIQGTSMSSPHVAGAGALVAAVQPSWTPQEIESALMTTANPNHVKEDGVTPADPFDLGTGRIDLLTATQAGLLLHETKANFDAANPSTGGNPTTLNLASMGDGDCYLTCGWTRTVRNPTGTAMTWDGKFEGLNGLEATLSPMNFSLGGGASTPFSLTVDDVTGLTPGQWYFGTVTWTEQSELAPVARFPVAVRVTASTDEVIVTKTAEPSGTETGGTVDYEITVRNKVNQQRAFSVSDEVPANSSYVNGSATGGLTYSGGTNTLSWSGNLNAAQFVIDERSLGGYISMGNLGIPPMSKDSFSNLDTGCALLGGMDFYYLGNHYEDATFSINGVYRAGIVTVGPFAICPSNTNQSFPQPDTGFGADDNLLAPWWTDLTLDDPDANWYFAGLTHNGTPHTVLEWENVPLVSDPGTKVTFQIWIEEGTDNIWFAYPPGGVPSGTPTATVGAENADGTEGVQYYYNGTGTVPDGSTDIWVGLDPAVKTFTFQTTATGSNGDNILNEVEATVASNTDTAWANTHICGAAVAVQPEAYIAGPKQLFVGLDWSTGASVFNTYEVWQSTSPYFAPGVDSTLLYDGRRFSFIDHANGPSVGNPAENNYYVLRTVNCAGTSTADADPVAEFDFGLVAGDAP